MSLAQSHIAFSNSTIAVQPFNIRYTRKQLYELVADVDNYRYFIPYCTDSKVHSSQSVQVPGPGGTQAVEKKQASLTVGFLAFKESYLSEVTCTPFSSVEVRVYYPELYYFHRELIYDIYRRSLLPKLLYSRS